MPGTLTLPPPTTRLRLLSGRRQPGLAALPAMSRAEVAAAAEELRAEHAARACRRRCHPLKPKLGGALGGDPGDQCPIDLGAARGRALSTTARRLR